VCDALDAEHMRTTSAFIVSEDSIVSCFCVEVSQLGQLSGHVCEAAMRFRVMFVIIVMCGRGLQKLVGSFICGVVTEESSTSLWQF
jgi:hypothetical protein